jgi:hypothetical protein
MKKYSDKDVMEEVHSRRATGKKLPLDSLRLNAVRQTNISYSLETSPKSARKHLGIAFREAIHICRCVSTHVYSASQSQSEIDLVHWDVEWLMATYCRAVWWEVCSMEMMIEIAYKRMSKRRFLLVDTGYLAQEKV